MKKPKEVAIDVERKNKRKMIANKDDEGSQMMDDEIRRTYKATSMKTTTNPISLRRSDNGNEISSLLFCRPHRWRRCVCLGLIKSLMDHW